MRVEEHMKNGKVFGYHLLSGKRLPMSADHPTVNRIKALDMLSHSSASDGMAPTDRATLEDALEHDLDAASHQAADSENRLSKIEGQVEALSDAIIAIAEPSDAVDDAVKSVKDKM